MAGDVFNDPKTMEAISAATERTRGSMEQTRVFAGELNTVLNDVLRTSREIERGLEAVGADPETVESYRKIHQSLVSDAGALRDIIGYGKKVGDQDKKRSRELMIQTKMLKEIRLLNRQLLADSVKKDAVQQAAAKKQQDAAAKEKKEQGIISRFRAYANKDTAASMNFMAKTAGIGGVISANSKGLEISFAGILSLILKMFDVGSKIKGSMSQTAAQFVSFRKDGGAWAKSTEVARKAIEDVKYSFALSAEESGGIVSNLARAGIEEEEMGKSISKRKSGQEAYHSLASRMLGTQYAQQRSMDEQITNIMTLRNNFSLLVSSAQSFDVLMADIGRRIPGLSPQEAVAGIQEMAQGMRAVNIDVLDSITLFHSLGRDAEKYRKSVAEAKDKSEKTGQAYQAPSNTSAWGPMAAAPGDIRKKLLQYLSSMHLNVDMGTQALIGRRARGGATAPEQREKFIQMTKEGGKGIVEAYTTILQEVMERAGTGPAAGIKAQSLLQGTYGMDQELALYLAQMVKDGKIDIEQLQKLRETYDADTKAMQEEAKKKDQLGDRLLRTGSAIANNLKSTQDWLQSKLEKYLVTPIMQLAAMMGALAKVLADKWDVKKEFQEALGALWSGPAEEKRATEKSYGKITGENRRSLEALADLETGDIEAAGPSWQAKMMNIMSPLGDSKQLLAEIAVKEEKLKDFWNNFKDPKVALRLLQRRATDMRGQIGNKQTNDLEAALVALVNAQASGTQKASTKASSTKDKARAAQLGATIPKAAVPANPSVGKGAASELPEQGEMR